MRHVNPNLVIERLREKCKPLREVAGSGELAQALKDVRAVPAAYVVPSDEKSVSVLSGSIARRQRAEVEFTIVLICKNYTQRMAQAADALQPCLLSIADALEQWVPQPGATGMLWTRGSMYEYRGDSVIWEERYTTTVATTRGLNS